MAISLDKVMGLYENALKLRAQRTEILAANIANADTPKYKARDMDFHAALKSRMGMEQQKDVAMLTTREGHIKGEALPGGFDNYVKYRIPHQPSLDGNTVESHIEQAAFARHAVEYQASLKFLEGSITGITKAIKGGE